MKSSHFACAAWCALAFAAVDKAENWRADLEKNLWERQLLNGRETRKYWDDLAVPLRATLDDLGLLKQ